MSYSNCHECLNALQGIEAIDYFFALQIQKELGSDDELLFHLMLACQWALRQGHTRLPLTEIAGHLLFDDCESESTGYRFADLETLENCVQLYPFQPEEDNPVVFDDGALYLRRYWQFEVEVSCTIKERISHTPLKESQLSQAKTIIDTLFSSDTDSKTDWQKVAVANALGRKLSIISGGPGTGNPPATARD